MNELSPQKKKDLLEKVIWDYNISHDDLLDILEGKQTNYSHIDRKYLINRCFNYLNWYQFISLFDENELLEVLQLLDDHLNNFNKKGENNTSGLKFAKRFLQKETISASG